jgi:hypothetical protein
MCITALLLAVYAFIATPVQLWHQHDYVATSLSESVSKEIQSPSFSTSAQQVVDASCQVCSHYYSTFIGTEVVRFEAPFVVAPTVEQSYVFAVPSSPFQCFSNKGPPALS